MLLAFCQIGFGFKKGSDAVLDLGTGVGTNFGRPIAFLLRKGTENRCQNWDPQLEIRGPALSPVDCSANNLCCVHVHAARGRTCTCEVAI